MGGMKNLADALLYGILDLGYVPAAPGIEHVAGQMLAGGASTCCNCAPRGRDETEIESLCARLLPLTESAGVPLIINDYPQLVPSVGAQGAHVGQDDFAVSDARWRAGRALAGEVPPPIIGKSTHSFRQAVPPRKRKGPTTSASARFSPPPPSRAAPPSASKTSPASTPPCASRSFASAASNWRTSIPSSPPARGASSSSPACSKPPTSPVTPARRRSACKRRHFVKAAPLVARCGRA